MIEGKYITLIILSFISLSAYASSDIKSEKHSHLKLCNTSDINIVFVFDVGRAELYLPDCTVLDYSEFMLAITYNRPFTAEEFITSSDELISRNNSVEAYEKIKDELNQFNSQYQGVEQGDEYRISHTNVNGLSLHKNGLLISSSDNKDLAMAYFKVWFGEKPFHKKMKKNLLNNIKPQVNDKSIK